MVEQHVSMRPWPLEDNEIFYPQQVVTLKIKQLLKFIII